jgi:hypothetical protein
METVFTVIAADQPIDSLHIDLSLVQMSHCFAELCDSLGCVATSSLVTPLVSFRAMVVSDKLINVVSHLFQAILLVVKKPAAHELLLSLDVCARFGWDPDALRKSIIGTW